MVGVLNIAAQNMDILPDTWVAKDALGRVMPDAEVAPLRTDKPRTVGIFYVTWHAYSPSCHPRRRSCPASRGLPGCCRHRSSFLHSC